MIRVKNQLYRLLIFLTIIYAFCAFLFCYIVISHLDASIVIHNTSPDIISGKGSKVKTDSNKIQNLIITDIPNDAESISFSYEDKYCTYLYNSEIYIKELATNKLVRKISEKTGIMKSMLMGNRNIIMYFSISNNKLKLKTYNIESDLITEQKSFTIPKNSTIKSIDYSSSTNLIFINIEQTNGNNKTDSIYYLNIMKNLRKISPGYIVNNMLLLNNSPTLYFEDDNNNLYYHSKLIPSLKGVHLIGCDANDNVYAKSLGDESMIYVLNNGKVIKTLNLNDPNFIGFYTNKVNVYVIYSNYIINLAGDMNAKLTYNSDLRFMGIGGSNVYFKDNNDNIVARKRTI